MNAQTKDHGGGLDAAIAQYGGTRDNWLDLSTGINPVAYPLPAIPDQYWQNLPDQKAQADLLSAARQFWTVPDDAGIIACPGLSQMIACLPMLHPAGPVQIDPLTYNEHAAAFRAHGWNIAHTDAVRVVVHPNNPDGRLAYLSNSVIKHAKLIIIDESFCDTCPDASYVKAANQPNVIVLKGLGKFWGLAGLRLGLAISHPDTIDRLHDLIGPWAVSGPAQYIGARALADTSWAKTTRTRLSKDSKQLDDIMQTAGYDLVGGTDLFRLYDTPDATDLQAKLAQNFIWSRRFPYSKTWLRLGLPGRALDWQKLTSALDLK